MKILKSFLLMVAICLACILSCRKNDIPRTEPDLKLDGEGVMAAINAEVTAANELFKYGATHPGAGVKASMMKTAEIMRKMRGVKFVEVYDSLLMHITVDNGLSSSLRIDLTTPGGESISRGGQPGGEMRNFLADESTRVNMKNKKVLFFCPAYTDLYRESNHEEKNLALLNSITNSPAAAQVRIEREKDSTWHLVERFKDYGMVLLSTHGMPYGFLYGYFSSLEYELGIDTVTYEGERYPSNFIKMKIGTEQALRDAFLAYNRLEDYNLLMSGDLESEISFRIDINNFDTWYNSVNRRLANGEILEAIVTSKFIERMNDFDSTVVFANMCYSGTSWNGGRDKAGQLGIRDAMLKKKLASYYGWVGIDNKSRKIANVGALQAEEAFINNMFFDLDTTGAANTIKGNEVISSDENNFSVGVRSNMRQYGPKNYWYGCGEGSFTDPRDQQTYRTICINGKQWFAENLKYNAAGSVSPNGQPANIGIFGRLYTWSQLMNGEASSNANPSKVKGLCPQGWHIPSLSEYEALFSYVGGIDKAGRILKSKTDWKLSSFPGVDSLKFSVVPAGGYEPGPGYFSFGDFETLWTSYSPTANFSTINAVQFSNFSNGAFIAGMTNPGQSGNPKYFPCRCAKD